MLLATPENDGNKEVNSYTNKENLESFLTEEEAWCVTTLLLAMVVYYIYNKSEYG